MKAILLVVCVLLAMQVFAQQTQLSPTAGGNAKAGESLLSNCQPPQCFPPATPGTTKVLRPAVVMRKNQCGCPEEPDCNCKKNDYIAPELKADAKTFCGCIGQIACGCDSQPKVLVEANTLNSNTQCGCISQPVCPCRS